MKWTKSTSGLLQGAMVLSAAAILSKLIGTLQKIPLQNLGGDAAFGIYNTVYPLYSLLVTAAMLGLPAAVSKAVAEAEAGGRAEETKRLLRLTSLLTIFSGLLLGVLVYGAAPLIAGWIGTAQVVPALRCAAFALAVVPVMGTLRGYFQGLHNSMPAAASQIAEQTVRVIAMIALLLALTASGAGAGTIAAGALIGSGAGGLAGLAVVLLYLRAYRRDKARKAAEGPVQARIKEKRSQAPTGGVGASGLLAYGVPVMLGALAMPLIGLVDVFTVPRLLSGQTGQHEAMVQFGIYNRGLPLVQLVTMLGTSLSVLFIPALAASRAKGDWSTVRMQTGLALRWFWLLGLAAAAGLAVLAVPVNIALYGDDAGSAAIAWLAFSAAGGTVGIISAALLQGLGRTRAPALHFLAAALLKAALALLLVPQQGIVGAAISTVAAYGLAAALNVSLLRRETGLRLRAADAWARPALLTAGLALAAAAASWGAGGLFAAAGMGGGRLASLAQSVLGVAAGCAAFLGGAARLRLLSEEELRQLPAVGHKLAGWLAALRLFPRDKRH